MADGKRNTTALPVGEQATNYGSRVAIAMSTVLSAEGGKTSPPTIPAESGTDKTLPNHKRLDAALSVDLHLE